MSTNASAAVAAALERIEHVYPYAALALSDAADPGPPWRPLEAFADMAVVDHVIQRTRERSGYEASDTVLGTYVFRYLLNTPLRALGFIFATQQRVLQLAGNVLLEDEEWLRHMRIRQAHLTVLAGDALEREPGVEVVPNVAALTDRLFDELAAVFEPLIAAFEARRRVARPNAWGSILDAVVQGGLLAHQAGVDADLWWRMWQQAIDGRTFPLRRRPRRVQIAVEDAVLERAVRSGCCLYYTTPTAKSDPDRRYCTTCYLLPDDVRAERLREHHARTRDTT